MRSLLIVVVLNFYCLQLSAAVLSGRVMNERMQPLPFATVVIADKNIGATTDDSGRFVIDDVPNGTQTILVSALGYEPYKTTLTLKKDEQRIINVSLKGGSNSISEVVVTGTMKSVSKADSPVPIEIYSSKYFKANPTPSLFDALQYINGVRPQLNCNICNTGDIHINGLEGPYTMVLIDGMPVVSGLSTVYGLSGIPQALIDRVEVVKGPASTLYGSEAVGGVINVITKSPEFAPVFSADVFGTTWREYNADISFKQNVGKHASSLLGISYYNYQHPEDNNGDNFTDVALQNRLSVFNKWTLKRSSSKNASIAGRYIIEDRWGGEMQWESKYRGGNLVYGESITTNRWEIMGVYELPVKEQLVFSWSANGHHHNSAYGNVLFMAKQYIAFGQLTWNKQLQRHGLLAGATYRYTFYDDNTPVTATLSDNKPFKTSLPGVFVQDEINIAPKHKLLLGARYDYNSLHGSIFTPRINYKWNDKTTILRLSIGNGYRIANVFTEDHAALTGARKVVFEHDLQPERSWNANINAVKKIYASGKAYFNIDASAFYTYFTNRIIADYDTDPNKIIYDNLSGYAVSKGISLNLDIATSFGLKLMTGATFMNVYSVENGVQNRQAFTEKFSGVWNIGYAFKRFRIDYTGNVYSPMRLPLLSATDPRKPNSPWWSIQNVKITYTINRSVELYCGVKNLLNWTPQKGNPFLIARANDPFDKNVSFDAQGQALATPENPYALTFDPNYVYAPNQGIRGFVGLSIAMNTWKQGKQPYRLQLPKSH